MTNKELEAYKLGAFAAEFLLTKGAIQPDFQSENIRKRDGQFVFVDYADVEVFNLPSDLTTDIVRKIKESILSLAENFEGDFSLQSYVRAGFVSKAGLLGHMVYEDARDNNYCSFLFVDKKLVSAKHSLYRITKWTDVKTEIGEWIEFSKGGNEDVSYLENFSVINKYYFNMMSLMEALIMIRNGQSRVKESEIVFQMSVQAMKFGMPYTAYGLALKANALGGYEHFSQTISQIIAYTQDEILHYKDKLDGILAMDTVEILWYLEDLDITVPDKR